jgi:putative drug exporter of the RND superfamily
MSGYLYRLARWCYEHRRRVLVARVVVAAVVISLGVAGHGKQNDNITIPGTESQHVVNLLKQKLPALSGAQTQVAFVSTGASSMTSSAHASGIEAAIREMDRVP